MQGYYTSNLDMELLIIHVLVVRVLLVQNSCFVLIEKAPYGRICKGNRHFQFSETTLALCGIIRVRIFDKPGVDFPLVKCVRHIFRRNSTMYRAIFACTCSCFGSIVIAIATVIAIVFCNVVVLSLYYYCMCHCYCNCNCFGQYGCGGNQR